MANSAAEGEQIQLIKLKRKRSAVLAQLTKSYNNIERLMVNYENVDAVEDLYSKLEERYNEFTTRHLDCLDVCSELDVVQSLEQQYDSCKNNYEEFQERFVQWKAGIHKSDADGGSVVSSVSTRTSNSARSKLSYAKEKRLLAEHKIKSLKQKQELEMAQKELEHKQQMLDQESELERAQIVENIMMESDESEQRPGSVEQDITCDKNVDSDRVINTQSLDSSRLQVYDNNTRDNSVKYHTNKNDNTSTTSETHELSRVITNNNNNQNKHVSTISPSVSGTPYADLESAFQRLAFTLHEGFNMPKPELLTFGGSPTEFCKFIRNFDVNIDDKVCNDRQKLCYLIQHCTGEARACIEDCVLLEPEEGYKKARSLLFSRYGRPHVIARAYVDKLVNGPQIKVSDNKGLLQLALDMQKCEITLSQLGFESDANNSETLRRIVKRLPMYLRVKWVDVAHSISESGREPKFGDLSKFVDDKSRVASSMYAADLNNTTSKPDFKTSNKTRTEGKSNTYVTHGDCATRDQNVTCLCCSKDCSDLSKCGKFKSLKLKDRLEFLKGKRLCFNCLREKHMASKCNMSPACTVPNCKLKHNVLLHSWVKSGSNHTATQPSVNCASTSDNHVKNCLGIIPVRVFGDSGVSCETYALIDDGADKTLCDERLIQKLKVSTKPVTFKLSTVSSSGNITFGEEVDLHVQSVADESSEPLILKRVWSVKRLPISKSSAATNADISSVSHLSDIKLSDADIGDVMLLIGTDSPAAHVPLEVRSGKGNEPYAVRTCLGWAVRGPVSVSCFHSDVNVHFQQSENVILQQQLERLWNTDFDDVKQLERYTHSVEDKRVLKMLEESIEREDGHYKLPLPWRDQNIKLPDNKSMAYARLEQLRKKLSRDEKLHQMYTTAVNDYIEKGYAEEVSNVGGGSDKIWYLPHHPVTNVNKPGKVRVVFDCAAKFRDVSLNGQLLSGPDLMNSLVGILIRFRQEPIAIAADIEAMFHQVKVRDKDCDVLRFLWWPGGDLTKQPKIYRMKVHLFGATSSPCCTAFALQKTAEDNADEFSKDVVSTLKKNFYVDDCLKSVADEETAVQLSRSLRNLLRKGGFRLTKWLSNSRKVLSSIPCSEHAPAIACLNPDDSLPQERALGINWDVNEDKITLCVKIEDKPLTRRGLLSTISTIFDPLGIVAPVTLRAKAIVQNLCRQKIGWDEAIPVEDKERWLHWLSSLPCLEQVRINRCYKPVGMENIQNRQLHLFSDGSETGYGACAYLRLAGENGEVYCSLLAGKSRLAPMKKTTIPRLELSGAVCASRLCSMIKRELEVMVDQTVFWTDSTIVLGYLRNESRRFKTFVGNRVSEIQDLTDIKQWRHVDTRSNPADIASRGIDADDAGSLKKWVHGPDFLLLDESKWPQRVYSPDDISEDDKEVKRNIVTYTTTPCDPINKLFEYFSDWEKLLRSVAWFLRFKKYCRQRYLNRTLQCNTGELTLRELRQARVVILENVQKQHFNTEIERLKMSKCVQSDSSISALNPVFDGYILRLKGRNIDVGLEKYPIILPQKHHVTKLIIQHYHKHSGHVGAQQVLANLRSLYWIVKGLSAVKSVTKNCIICKRLRGILCKQQMAPLRTEQLTADKPPFTYTGVDFFGPLQVKFGRGTAKRYGCLFTCLTSRAVHLEVTHSLTTDSFIAAFQRFICRRGTPEKVYSDNGTNIVSGQKELCRNIREWNQSKIGKFMVQKEIDWHFNPPYASHMGGAWERLIRSTRSILKTLTDEQRLTDEQLLTFMTETEKILNDRPITQVSSDPNDPQVLTPNMLLLMKSNACVPQGTFSNNERYAKRWWKQVQYFANVFWRRWVKEYIPNLQSRQKWRNPQRNLNVGDIVLVVDEKTERGMWPIGRILDVSVGRDGHVRSCVVRSRGSEFTKPITKLCLLEGLLD